MLVKQNPRKQLYTTTYKRHGVISDESEVPIIFTFVTKISRTPNARTWYCCLSNAELILLICRLYMYLGKSIDFCQLGIYYSYTYAEKAMEHKRI